MTDEKQQVVTDATVTMIRAWEVLKAHGITGWVFGDSADMTFDQIVDACHTHLKSLSGQDLESALSNARQEFLKSTSGVGAKEYAQSYLKVKILEHEREQREEF